MRTASGPCWSKSIIVWDLETVPDLAAAARMLDMPNATDGELREALGDGFPKHPLHKIVCIGALVAGRQADGWRVDALGAPHIGERPEPELISSFIEKIGQVRPQLVTFNGHSFDLPVLRYRAMVNRISAVGLQVRPYFHRYTEDALDLCDMLGSYVPVPRSSWMMLARYWVSAANRRASTAVKWSSWSLVDRSRKSLVIARATS